MDKRVVILNLFALGDGSKVLMLVHVSPCDEDVGETICSLSFAKRARAVESVRELSEVLILDFFIIFDIVCVYTMQLFLIFVNLFRT